MKTIILLFAMGVALVLVVVIGYVLRLLAGLGGPSRRGVAGGRPTGPDAFAPYLEELDGSQLDALQRFHAPSSLPTLFTHDHAKEQLV